MPSLPRSPLTTPLDWTRVSLRGSHLIEAGAGTGKTFTIAGLFLRLVMEAALPVDRIMVVTFTNTAAEELRDRLRAKLVAARALFSQKTSHDRVLDELVRRHSDPIGAQRRLEDALVDFDRAAVYTIHGFCQRVLNDNAFESGALFDTTLVADPQPLRRELAEDFWRRHLYGAPEEVVGYAVRSGKVSGPEALLRLLPPDGGVEMEILPAAEAAPLAHLQPFRRAYDTIRAAWPAARPAVADLFRSEGLGANRFGSLAVSVDRSAPSGRERKVAALLQEMDLYTGASAGRLPCPQALQCFTPALLENATRKGYTPPRHRFFEQWGAFHDLAQTLGAEMDAYLLNLQVRFLQEARQGLAQKKRRQNVQHFDDLLRRVRDALRGTAGESLAAAVRGRYRAALVDEFQDTDAMQYEIFARLFESGGHPFFMIGDPKQAIYGFRGADIFTYMRAARMAPSRFTLTGNWRSEANLVAAVNTLFKRADHPFVFEEVPFEPAVSATSQTPDPGQGAALKLWYLKGEDDRPVAKGIAEQQIAAAVADEVARLISPAVQRDAADPMDAGDIAVLVRTNRQAQIVKRQMAARQVPAVLYNTGNVFHTAEALEMAQVLAGVLEPSRLRRVKAALATDLLGVKAAELDFERSDAPGCCAGIERFAHYREVWQRHGFMAMWQRLMAAEDMRPRLLAFPDGERRLTDVLHLAEILHREDSERRLGATALLRWLGQQRDSAAAPAEAHQLRLESDADAAKIVTIHKSKGLEYPVVFCPYCWQGSRAGKEPVRFHRRDAGGGVALDLGSDELERHRRLAAGEILSENLRLLYVAVTRARQRCYLVWGRIHTAETSALAYLLHARGGGHGPGVVEKLERRMKKTSQEVLQQDLHELAAASQGAIEIADLPGTEGIQAQGIRPRSGQLFARRFEGNIDHTRIFTSYSAIVSQQASGSERPDRDRESGRKDRPDALEGLPAKDRDATESFDDIAFFPKGARAGLFFHEIFEHFDFTGDTGQPLSDCVATHLRRHGLSARWTEAVCGLVRNVIQVPLHPQDVDLRLERIASSDRIHEMAFHFPLRRASEAALAELRHAVGPRGNGDLAAALERLPSPPPAGFMKGYIDLVFRYDGRYYLIDWKSNRLASGADGYTPQVLTEAIRQEGYGLQYHLYALALHRYLRQRLAGYRYDRHFGGIFYIFLRGVSPALGPGHGIYSARPCGHLMRRLEKTLAPAA